MQHVIVSQTKATKGKMFILIKFHFNEIFRPWPIHRIQYIITRINCFLILFFFFLAGLSRRVLNVLRVKRFAKRWKLSQSLSNFLRKLSDCQGQAQILRLHDHPTPVSVALQFRNNFNEFQKGLKFTFLPARVAWVCIPLLGTEVSNRI